MKFFCASLIAGLLTAAAWGQSNPQISVQPIPPSDIPRPEPQPLPGVIPPPHATPPPNAKWLVFDADSKDYDAKEGEAFAPFSFTVTNRWTNDITIDKVQASCGCTTASLPSTPWTLHPGDGGPIAAKVNLAGKSGRLTKLLTFYTSVGNRTLTLHIDILSLDPTTPMDEHQRLAALAKAAQNAQAIFKGDCALCHEVKGRDKMGEALYVADCAVCHESPRRASFVPDLHALKQPGDFDFWKATITFGKSHTLMPAFAQSQGGPLTDAQVASLAEYLNRVISHNFAPAPTTNAAAASAGAPPL